MGLWVKRGLFVTLTMIFEGQGGKSFANETIL